jgi:hypothetical protein
MIDHSKPNYYETQESDGYYRFKVYHYDRTGNKEIRLHTSEYEFENEDQANDAATDWLEENKIEAEPV